MTIAISKSKYLAGLQCPKLLWYHYKQPAAVPPADLRGQLRRRRLLLPRRHPGARS